MTETTVRKQYDQLAAVYDLRWKSYIAKTLSFLKTWAEISRLNTVLDIACGTGEFERLLLSEYSSQQIVGVDISEKMLAIAKHKLKAYPQVLFKRASASNLPFDSNSFDVIVCANSFHYFDNPSAALTEMRRVLKPKGKVIILDWCRDYLSCKICDLILKYIDPAHKRCYTQEEFHSLLRDANFVLSHADRIRFGVVWGLMVATASLKV
ncbi:methyltransferase type 11 [Nostoc sp. T09]|uniref:class I SAM-dependent methyltransferase n=1 Tax=Nostoc sp. T09 TaxID=1932621 RepID=UPI000A3A277A|nr:class I SAM-dependent methyltransferase [Nostoc sp. T09]OUL34181.1 methyltransferase type 11 [Nostoc sp. T09]